MPRTIGASRANVLSEQACIALLCAWLVWLPLPFGSNVAWARLPLVAIPLFCCAAACVLRVSEGDGRINGMRATRAWELWSVGAVLFLLVGALQLLPLPPSLHRLLEPQSFVFHASASRLASIADAPVSAWHPLTLDPTSTLHELLRLTAVLAAFTAAALLVRTHARRMAIGTTLVVAASFEALYGVREAAMQRHAIWGWVNRLVHDRVTGTFVNPNHFAHYLAITLPMSAFLVAAAWRDAGREPMPFSRRITGMLERRPLLTGIGVLGAFTSLLGLMLAQSRGALLALATGILLVLAVAPGRRVLRLPAAAGAAVLLFVAVVILLGPDRTVGRFRPTEAQRETLVGRTTGIATGARLWQRFPLAGSGWGTFEQVSSIEQKDDLAFTYNHAHNDYIEIAATSGTLGAVIAIVTLFGGAFALLRITFGDRAKDLSWRRRAWQAAALASLAIAMVHALFDFNFYIPANAATLAVILGVAVAPVNQDMRTRR
jgi:putative inorganic carbon (HCO3(-)) transporter